MTRRPLLLCLVCLGCHTLAGPEEKSEPRGNDPAPPAAKAQVSGPSAETLWQRGQAAMKTDRAAEAIELYQRSLALSPEFDRNHLSLAAAHLEQGDHLRACAHLAKFVERQPEHRNARYLFAELLFKLGRNQEAKEHFERVIADSQEDVKTDTGHLIHCHGRLSALAEREEDDFEENFQRGVALYWLALDRAQLGDPEGELPAEALLCKAAGALSSARNSRRGEARPCWYLHLVWSKLGQTQQARRWVREAQTLAPFSSLTPAEQRGLHLAHHGDIISNRR